MICEFEKNIEYFLGLPKKSKYDRTMKYPIANFNGQIIYFTEFLYAKNRGLVNSLQGHNDIVDEYYKLLPYLQFNELFQNIENKRLIYSIFDNTNEQRRIFHIRLVA